MARRYIHEQLSTQLKERLEAMGVKDFRIENVTTKNDGSPIDSDKDPTVILVWYEPVCQETIDYIQPRVKVEISCLSMSEPKEVKPIRSLISGSFAEEDEGTGCGVALVVPERTFLEKAFLLNEEFQKEHPRHVRMSRHLYDLYKLMDTDYGKAALADGRLYGEIVKHRSLYYALKHVDYNRHSPELIDFCPAEALLPDWSRDYDNMLESFIYGKAPSFDELIEAIRGLVERFRKVHCGSESTFG